MRELTGKECFAIQGSGLIQNYLFFRQTNPASANMARQDLRTATYDAGIIAGGVGGTLLTTTILAGESPFVLLSFGAMAAWVGMTTTPVMLDLFLFGGE